MLCARLNTAQNHRCAAVRVLFEEKEGGNGLTFIVTVNGLLGRDGGKNFRS